MTFWKHPAARRRFLAVVSVVALLVGAVLLNLLAGLLPYAVTHPSLSEERTFYLSDESLNWLSGLGEDVTISLICEAGKYQADPHLYAFLSRFAAASAHIRVRVVDPVADAEFLAERGAEDLSDLSMIVESRYRTRLIDNTQLYYYVNSTYGMTMSPSQYESTLAQCNEMDSTGAFAAEFASLTLPYFDGEFYLINAINYVVRPELSILYTLTGSGASKLDGMLSGTLDLDCYEQRELPALQHVPDDCDLLVIYAPVSDLTEQEATVLSAYLADGGKLFLSTDYENGVLPILESVLLEYGMSYGDPDAIVCDEENVIEGLSEMIGNYMSMKTLVPDPFVSYLTSSNIFEDLHCTYLNWLSHEIKLSEADGVSTESLIKTSDRGYLSRYDEKNDKWGKLCYDEEKKEWVENADAIEHKSYCVGATAKKGETEILWISSVFSLTSFFNSFVQDSENLAFACSALDCMSGNDNTVLTTDARAFSVMVFTPTEDQISLWGIVLVIVIPAVPAAIGALRFFSKRRK